MCHALKKLRPLIVISNVFSGCMPDYYFVFLCVQAEKSLQEEELAHLVELKKLGVDLTTYLVSQYPKPDQVLRVITKGDNGGHVHIHP